MAKLKVLSRYGIIPNDILNSEELSLKAKGIFAYIQSKPDGWKFSAEKISLQSSDGIDSVQSGLQELEKHGHLIRSKVKNPKGTWDWDYTLSEKPLVENPPLENPRLENRHNNSKQDIVNKIKNNITISTQSESLVELFELFWKAYPRKESKKKALQSFEKIKPKNNIFPFREIMDGLARSRKTSQWRKDNGQFIPHATTWLNQERWKDEIVGSVPSESASRFANVGKKI